jgi:hypothetical protein
MVTLDEAAGILTEKSPSLSKCIRLGAVSLWRDICLASSAPFRKTIEAVGAWIMYPLNELEFYLRHSRRLGFIEELGMEVPNYDFKDGKFRLNSADLLATLRGDAFLSCGHEEIRLPGMKIADRRNDAGTPSRLCKWWSNDQLKSEVSSW